MASGLDAIMGAAGMPGMSSTSAATASTGPVTAGGVSLDYRKPPIDMGNPWQVAALAAVVLVAVFAWRRLGK